MAGHAIEHNPGSCAELWNMLGDSLYELGRIEEARLAFERALLINGDEVRARYNLAFVHVLENEHQRALVQIAEALALDRRGAYRDRLLQKQHEVLGLLALQNQRRMLGQVDRVAGLGLATPR